MNLLKKKTRGDTLDASWMEKWHPLSIEFIPQKYQTYVKNEILKNVQPMNEQNQENMRNFQYHHLGSSEYISYNTKLKTLFSGLG